MNRRTLWLGVAFCFVAGDAMAMQSRGPLLSSFEETFGVSEALLGLVAPAGTVGFVLAIVSVGFLAGRLEPRRTLLVGASVMAAALLAIAVAPAYWLFLLALLVQGAAAGVFRAVDRPLLSHIYPGRLGRVFVLYGLAWAVGAVTGPLAVSAVLRVAEWPLVYALIAAWLVPIVAAVWWLDAPSAWDEDSLDRATLAALLEKPAIRGTVVTMALVGGIEGVIFTWIPYYAATFVDQSVANAALSAYLLAYLPGRFAYARIVDSTSYLGLSLAATALATPLLALAVSGRLGPWIVAATFGVGLFVSALFPLLSAYGVEAAPEYSGPVSALATAATYAGIATVPTVVGVVAEVRTIQEAMWIPVALTGALVVVLWRLRAATDGGNFAAESVS